jgi:ferrous iron transport protein A
MNRDKHNGVILIHNSRVALDNTILDNITLSKNSSVVATLPNYHQLNQGRWLWSLVLPLHPSDPAEAALKRRLLDMGVTRGTRIFVRKVAPLGDPMELHVRGYELTLRKNEAEKVEVSVLEND